MHQRVNVYQKCLYNWIIWSLVCYESPSIFAFNKKPSIFAKINIITNCMRIHIMRQHLRQHLISYTSIVTTFRGTSTKYNFSLASMVDEERGIDDKTIFAGSINNEMRAKSENVSLHASRSKMVYTHVH